jgi:dolichol-phosphate mannosyltransferase
MRVLVLMPTYNEIESIENSVSQVLELNPEVDILIIDDNSPDGTGALADRLAMNQKRVSVLHRKKKLGLGLAYVEGFQLGLSKGYDRLVEMDADGSHRAEDLVDLISFSKNADLVIGSRWVSGGEVANWSKFRVLISRLGNAYAALMLRSKVRDMTSGFRIYSKDLLEKLPLVSMQAHGYGFQVEMTYRSELTGASVLEVPIRFVEREDGRSKMTLAIVIEAFMLCTKWGLLRLMR